MKRDDHEVGMTHGGEVMESVKVVWGRRFHEAGRKGVGFFKMRRVAYKCT